MSGARAEEEVIFDPILPKDAPLPAEGQPPLVVARTYRAAHAQHRTLPVRGVLPTPGPPLPTGT